MLSQSLLESVTQIAYQAGAEIMKVYQSDDFQTEYKDDDSPLTLADKNANHCIIKGLKSLPVKYPVLSEESDDIDYKTRQKWTSFWLVDPLDGTKEFLKRNGEFTVNIALIHEGSPVLGVVYAPAKKSCYRAMKDFGSEKRIDDQWIKIFASKIKNPSISIVMSRSHPSEILNQFLKTIQSYKVVETGSSLKICYVAEGLADLYPRLGPTMEWDTAAAHCVLNESGGFLFTMENEVLKYNRKTLKNPYFVAISPAIKESALLKKLYHTVSQSNVQ